MEINLFSCWLVMIPSGSIRGEGDHLQKKCWKRGSGCPPCESGSLTSHIVLCRPSVCMKNFVSCSAYMYVTKKNVDFGTNPCWSRGKGRGIKWQTFTADDQWCETVRPCNLGFWGLYYTCQWADGCRSLTQSSATVTVAWLQIRVADGSILPQYIFMLPPWGSSHM